ncbi:polymorphic toxin-type HINT domain-containing protein [Catellatospora sp. IY07-71]|uniref:polymorphic toxin-type HINT domain-containing protein n=1 Tax=Catellatospora sp. IY07-71 TaxID=2728827 RepID=UPI001BB44164|nr:polymorphic toxin-type HINT domain-containing protein [Catellatospora sp. IY07-71]
MRNVSLSDNSVAAVRPQKSVRQHQPSAARWPSPGSAVANLPKGQGRLTGLLARVDGPLAKPAPRVRAGDTPVTLAATSAVSPDAVRVEVLDRKLAKAAGRDLLMRLSSVGGTTAGSVELSLNISAFKSAYGADWSDRLRLIALPQSCGNAAGAACAEQRLATSRSGDTLTATVPMGAAGGTMVALAADTESASGSGDFAATSLAQSSTWSAGGNSGGFSWSYGLRVPPAIGGPVPKVTFAYSSQAVDGRTAATNSQPSWIGEGFDWHPGYIERRYISCSEDMDGSPNNDEKTYDQCWRGSNATMSLNGRSTELIYNATEKLWHGRSEDGSKIELKYGAANGDGGDAPGSTPSPGDAGEHWVVTGTEGTKYYFGLNRLQGWTAGKLETNSVQTVPVFGNHSGDPCHQASYAASDCMQAYRWNLDYVVDTHGNTMSFWWGRDTNQYGMNLSTTDLHSYTRDAYLQRIDYGTHQRTLVNNVKTDTVYTTKPVPMQVEFATADRCLSNCGTHDDNWPDTPWDLSCTASPCDKHSPAFFSTRRLSEVTTSVWEPAVSDHKLVEKWTLTHGFPDPGDGTRAGMWLEKVSHSGHIGPTPTTPATVSVPDIKFDPVMLPNRVDTALKNGLRPMNWARMAAITTETGGVIGIEYAASECVAGSTPTAHTNTKRCYPVRWAPEDLGGTPGQEITDWFHKYVVAKVTESDLVLKDAAASPPKVTRYEYVGGAAWRYAEDDAFTKDKYRTWNQFRGYDKVRTLVGEGADQVRSEARYFRGMHGDKTAPAGGTDTVTLADSKGLLAAAYPTETIYDYDEYAGMNLESTQYDGPAGNPISGSVTKPWRSNSTASRTVDGQTVHARFTADSDDWSWTKLDGGRPDQVTRNYTEYDQLGMPVKATAHGDVAKSGDEQCTFSEYKRNTNAFLMSYPSRVRVWALTCADALQAGRIFTKDEIVSEVRTYYDGQAWDLAPTVGEVTQVDALKEWTDNAFVPVTVSRSAYDDYGRQTDAWDVDNVHTSSSYTPAADGPLTATSETHVLGTTTRTAEPAWGAVTSVVDVNSRRTDVTYDPLGRTEKVWQPGRSKALYSSTPSSWYVYTLSNTAPSVVETRTLGPNGTMLSSFTLHDGLLRPRQTQSLKANGVAGAMITDSFFDTAGRVWRNFGPYPVAAVTWGTFSPHPASDMENIEAWAKTEFDGAGRPVEQIRYSKLTELYRTSTRYPSGDRTELIPPQGGLVTSTIVDAQGRTTKLREHHGPTPASTYDETTYDYDQKGKLERVTNQLGTKWEFEYDVLGRQIEARDPDKGTTTTTYDTAGRVTSTTDSRVPPVTLRYTYDNLGRKTGLYQGSIAPANRLSKWEYDGLANGKGMMTSSTRYVGGESGAAYSTATTAVSPFGTPSQQKISIPATETGLAGDYLYDYGYKANGELATLRLPAIGNATYSLGWETQTTSYNGKGLPQKLSTGATTWLVTDTTYTEYGELGVITLRDQTANPQLQIGHYYDDQNRRLERIWTTRDTAPTTVSDVNLGYDKAGTLVQVEEKSAVAGVETQCFSHDYLRRLKEAWTLASGDCGAVPQSFSAVGGVEKYWLSWEIDAGGNRTKQVQHKSVGDVTTKYVYPAPTAAQPHTLQRTTDANNVTTANYTYDGTGNTRCRPAGTSLNTCPSGTGSQVLTWDPEGRVASSTDSTGLTSYLYDADGGRLIRKDPQGKTLYLPGQELRVNAAGSAVISCTRYYTWAGKNIATRSSSASGADALTWMVADRQNSANITVKAAGAQAVAVKRQDPYGNQRGSTVGVWEPTLDRGFVGGTNDNTGLVHLGAREYDAKIGRFISVDPVMDLADPQQLQAYSYAGNSPILRSDPSGLLQTCDDNGGCNSNKKQACSSIKSCEREAENPRQLSLFEFVEKNWKTHPLNLSPFQQNDALEFYAFTYYEEEYAAWVKAKAAQDRAELKQFFLELSGIADAQRCFGGGDGQVLGCVMTTVNVATLGNGKLITTSARWAHGLWAADKVNDAQNAVSGINALVPTCAVSSFLPGTLVLLADGTTVPIEKMKIGDVVLATDPKTGRTEPKRVTATISSSGEKKLVQIGVDVDGDRGDATGLITATEHHPFWLPELGRWLDAAELRAGDVLQSDDSRLRVASVSEWVEPATVHNLSIEGIHTYYVVAGGHPVLVHNTWCPTAIALGLNNPDDPFQLAEFAQNTNSLHHDDWVIGPRDKWENVVTRALDPNSKTLVHFNLDGIDDPVAWAKLQEGKALPDADRFTAWELAQIKAAPAAVQARVTFYRNGDVVPNPFG